jgi:hypothetical protein
MYEDVKDPNQIMLAIFHVVHTVLFFTMIGSLLSLEPWSFIVSACDFPRIDGHLHSTTGEPSLNLVKLYRVEYSIVTNSKPL